MGRNTRAEMFEVLTEVAKNKGLPEKERLRAVELYVQFMTAKTGRRKKDRAHENGGSHSGGDRLADIAAKLDEESGVVEAPQTVTN